MSDKNDKGQKKKQVGEDSGSSDCEVDEEEGGSRVAGVYIPPAPLPVSSVDGTGPRLIITHIVNINFKSYAGRQVLGPFHKSFTCIVGPNGSGKSNVIDSMLFVFGYRSTKIRSKKISVLLHKSENHQNVQSATVEVHFCQIIDKEEDEYDIVPNSKIYVSRTAFADNSSHYSINGKRTQFKNVGALLGSHGIDLKHNRFLILQGEVEQIAMMKPKALNEHETGMLEYLEDIIGTSRYKLPLEKLETKFNSLNEERQERYNRTKLAEKEVETLRGPMMEAVEYLRLSNKKTKLNNKVLQIKKYKLTLEYKENLAEKEKLNETISKTHEIVKTNKAKISSIQKEKASKFRDLENLKTKKDKIQDSLGYTENRITQLKEEIRQLEKKLKKTEESKKQEEKKLVELERVPENNAKRIEELKAVEGMLVEKRRVEEEEVQRVLASLKEETKELQEKKDGFNNQLILVNKTKDEAKAKYELAKTELEVYLNNEKKEKAKLDQLKKTLENITSRLNTEKSTVGDLGARIPVAEDKLARSQTELAQLKEEEARIINKLNQERSVVEEKKQSLSSSTSRNRVLDFIMRLKTDGRIPGVFGRLGDLGGIDAKYDCAVSTACGTLDHIVVDTTNTAKKCVEALKQSGVGKGSFICLDQQRRLVSAYQQPFRAPEKVARLFDLIRVEDERVKPAFYFGLRDTLVAAELAQARRVAYGATRYRVVTLNGEIIEIAGTMSGGGRQKRTGRMGQSATVRMSQESPDQMKALVESVARLQSRASELHHRKRELEEEVASLIRNLRSWRTELGSAQFEVQSLSQQEPLLKQQVVAQRAAAAAALSNQEVVQDKNYKIEMLKEELDTAAEHSEKLENEVTKLNIKISAITEGRMQTAQGSLDKVTSQLDKITADITKLSVAIKTSARNSQKARDRIATLTNDLKNFQDKLTACANDKAAFEEKNEDLMTERQSLLARISEDESELSDSQAQISELNKEITKIQASTLDDEQQLQTLEKICKELECRLEQETYKISKLKLHVIPDEENANYDLETYTEQEIEEMIGHQYHSVRIDELLADRRPNPKAISDYKEKKEFFEQKRAELDDITARRDEARKGLEDARNARQNEFLAGYVIISSKLKEMYQMITLGGDAELELKDSLDPFSEGISFSVRPPKKSWKHISNLSGGEKTLSSLALVFALHYYKPSPLYVMDEIDAALDFKNVSIVGCYVKERTKNSQFIIISLRSNMFELADLLVGIYKTYNCTKSVTATPGAYLTKGVRQAVLGPAIQSEPENGLSRRSMDPWEGELDNGGCFLGNTATNGEMSRAISRKVSSKKISDRSAGDGLVNIDKDTSKVGEEEGDGPGTEEYFGPPAYKKQKSFLNNESLNV